MNNKRQRYKLPFPSFFCIFFASVHGCIKKEQVNQFRSKRRLANKKTDFDQLDTVVLFFFSVKVVFLIEQVPDMENGSNSTVP